MNSLKVLFFSVFALLFVATNTGASTPVFVANPSPLVAGAAASITVDNTRLTSNTLIALPGTDFTTTNTSCYSGPRYSGGRLRANVWYCSNRSAPIVFTSNSLAAADLTPDSYRFPFGYVGLIGTAGMHAGVWTLPSCLCEYDQQLASTL